MRGIMMIEPLYHATLAGRKTMTRRDGGLKEVNDTSIQINGKVRNPDDCKITSMQINPGAPLTVTFYKPSRTVDITCKSHYKLGEVVFIKEPISIEGIYKFSHPLEGRELLVWKNKMYMPAKSAREFIKITDIKIERLLEISDNDAKAEGVHLFPYEGWQNYDKKENPKVHSFGSPKKSFLSLYRHANKIKASEKTLNIWVFVYSYEYLPNYKLNHE